MGSFRELSRDSTKKTKAPTTPVHGAFIMWSLRLVRNAIMKRHNKYMKKRNSYNWNNRVIESFPARKGGFLMDSVSMIKAFLCLPVSSRSYSFRHR